MKQFEGGLNKDLISSCTWETAWFSEVLNPHLTNDWLISLQKSFSLCKCLWSLILGCRWCERLLFRKRKGLGFFLPLDYTIALKWLWERKVIFSFRRLSEDGVLFLALISTGSFAGTEVGGAPHLSGVASWGQEDSASPWAWPGLQVCVFLFHQKSLPPIERSSDCWAACCHLTVPFAGNLCLLLLT